MSSYCRRAASIAFRCRGSSPSSIFSTSAPFTSNFTSQIRQISSMFPTIDFPKESSRSSSFFTANNTSDATDTSRSVKTLQLVSDKAFQSWLKSQSSVVTNWIKSSLNATNTKVKFPGNKHMTLPTNDTSVCSVIFFKEEDVERLKYKCFDVPQSLYGSNFVYKIDLSREDATESSKTHASFILEQFCTAWALNSYQFNYYKNANMSSASSTTTTSKLMWPSEVSSTDRLNILSLAKSYTLMRDLTDSPALSLGPKELEEAAFKLLTDAGASVSVIRGVDELVKNNYPQIAAVGMGSSEDRQPRLVDAYWTSTSPLATETASGKKAHQKVPEVVIVGKGVIFDTGGLNIKGSSGMRTMKKDMAGAAQALALALHIIELKLPINLRVLLPIVENSISGASMRPGDVIIARNGKTTEITNTDAEGRLILADALVAANEGMDRSKDSSKVALIVDFATLTGAARVALGNEIPALFSNKEEELMKLWKLSRGVNDEMWMLPLAHRYKSSLKSSIADIINSVEGPGGAIIAALYLFEFAVPATTELNDGGTPTWFHIDFMGLEKGKAEPQGLRAVLEYIKTHVCIDKSD